MWIKLWDKLCTFIDGQHRCRVTNLNDSGPGSLREAMESTGPRIIKFNVTGPIVLSSPITLGGKAFVDHMIAHKRTWWLILDCGHWYHWTGKEAPKADVDFPCPECVSRRLPW